MSEDKLRTLLAEARHVECGTVDRCSMCERIDAALAEPVVDWQPHEPVERTEYVVRVERERDEARAEVERLKVTLVDWYKEGFEAGKGEKKEWSDASFRRGAEAMREEAAKFALVSAAIGHDAKQVAQNIRALPVPEDKP